MSRTDKPRRRSHDTARQASPHTTRLPSAWTWVLAGIFAAAWIWRALYLSRLEASPLADSRVADEQTYWGWASYLLAHGPFGRHPFFQGPLYPYLLAALRALLGDAPARILQAQALWGAASAVLLADAARRLTRPAFGVVVGLAVTFGAMAVFFDGLILAESLLFVLASVLLWSVSRALSRAPSLAVVAGWGALIGLMAEGRAALAVLLLPAAVLVWDTRANARAAWRACAVLAVTFVCVCAPAALHNRIVSGEWIPFTYNGGYNLYVGNHEGAQGSYLSVMGARAIPEGVAADEDGGNEGDGRRYIRSQVGHDLGATQSSAWWASRARSWMAAHPLRVVRLWALKAAILWNRRECPQIENVDEFAALAGPLGLPWLGSFALLGALCLGGCAFAWRHGPAGRFIVGYLTTMTLVLLPFFVTDRFRHALVPAALLAAAFAMDALWRARRQPALALALLPGAMLGLVLAFWPVPHLSKARYEWGLAGDLGERWLEHGNVGLSLVWFERGLSLDSKGVVRWIADAPDSLGRGEFLYNYARALAAAGRGEDALGALRRAAQLAPGSVVIREALATALAEAGDERGAAQVYGALGHASAAADAALARAWALARAGDLAGAEAAFAGVCLRDPGNGSAWGALVRLQVQRGRAVDARATFARARAAGWRGPAADTHEALVLVAEGRVADGQRLLARVSAGAIQSDPVLADVARAINAQAVGSVPRR